MVVPYFNRAEWLTAAVESVLLQTFSDFELIVVDDGSDEHPEFLGKDIDPRIRYVRRSHLGVSAARNLGVEVSTGTYVAFLDADDVFMPEKLEVQVGYMESHPDQLMSHTSYLRMNSAGVDMEEIRSGSFTGRVYPEIVMHCPIATPTVMVRREQFTRERFAFPDSVKVGEDTMLWIDIARGHEVLGIDQVLTRVRVHGRNAAFDPVAQYRGGIRILQYAFARDPEFGPSMRRRALATVCISAGHLFLQGGNRLGALESFMRAIAYWPFDRWHVARVLSTILPNRIVMKLRSLRRALRNRRGRSISGGM